MTENVVQVDVAVIGAGPAGLAAAVELRRQGVEQVIVLEREAQAGGVPRHCAHSPFGMREFYRLLTGPKYAKKLQDCATLAGVKILTRHSVVRLKEGGELEVATPEGLLKVLAKRVLIATGVRETPRSARLVTGARPLGITTTGALQSTYHLTRVIPYKKPVIIGTELVAFSSLLTALSAGIKPAAMVEKNGRVSARTPCQLLPLFKGIPLLLNAQLEEVLGVEKVVGIKLKDTQTGERQVINCDAVIFTGQFVPEATLGRMSHLQVDSASAGLAIDQLGRCSDPAYFAAGNILRPVETAGWSYREGVNVARCIAQDLIESKLNENAQELQLHCEYPIKFVVPQRIIVNSAGGLLHLQIRVVRAVVGEMIIESEIGILWNKKVSLLPERRMLIPIADIAGLEGSQQLKIFIIE